MTTLTITLPESLEEYIAAEVTAGGFADAGEYVTAVLCDRMKREAKARIDTLLLEGLESGEPTEMTAADWEDIRRTVGERPAERNGLP